ncbi:MAG: YybS family protein [Desulfobacteraceae bacterium]|nr:YybS family protein [Desulfobacteraceae bacterium]MCF8094352.1 YybS family protein [Desulfobacteraceae bacterium]
MPEQITSANSREILTGAGILVLCGTVSLYFPIAGFICFFLMPLPVAFYRIKLGRNPSGIMAVAALVTIWVLGAGQPVDLWLMLCMMGLGFALGGALEKGFSVEKAIAYACGVVLTGAIAALVFIGSISEAGPLELVSDYVRANLEMTAAVYENMGVQDNRIRLLKESLDRVHYVIMMIMPALAVSGLIFSAWANLLLVRITLRARQIGQPDFGRLNRWKAPDVLVWAVIGCGLVVLVAGEPLSFVGINGLILLMLIYLFQGLAVVSFYFESRQVPVFLRMLIYAFFAIQQVFALLIVGVGFFDTWADFRRLSAENDGNAGSS